LRGREGFGFLSPSRRAYKAGFGAFVEVKRLFFHCAGGKETEAKESHWVTGRVTGRVTRCVTRRWTGRGLSMTGASGQWQQLCAARGARVCNWRVRSLVGPARPVTHPGEQRGGKFDRTWWRVWSHATGRKSLSGSSLDSDWTLALSYPVVTWSASGHTLPESVTFRDRWKSNERDSKMDMWRASAKSCWCGRTLAASGRSDQCVRSTRAERHLEPNDSILWGCL
jgi:hypothetical protein